MNYLTLLQIMNGEQYLTHLQENLRSRHLLDENRNLTLENSTEQDFLEMFFLEKLFPQDKKLSSHTIKAYRSDAKTLLTFLTDHSLSFRAIGFPVVKAYNNLSKKSTQLNLPFENWSFSEGYGLRL